MQFFKIRDVQKWFDFANLFSVLVIDNHNKIDEF